MAQFVCMMTCQDDQVFGHACSCFMNVLTKPKINGICISETVPLGFSIKEEAINKLSNEFTLDVSTGIC
jgi:hypothetical protein